MLRRPHYIALGLVALLTLVILTLPSQTTARLKLAIGSLFLPLFGLASSSQQAANKAGDAIMPRSTLLQQNETYRRQIEQSRIETMRIRQIEQENNELRQLLGWKQKSKW